MFDYFRKIPKQDETVSDSSAELKEVQVDNSSDCDTSTDVSVSDDQGESTCSKEIYNNAQQTVEDIHPNDFGLAVNNNRIEDSDKLRYLTEFFTPPEEFHWPSATRIDRGKLIVCKLNRTEVLKRRCLAYSPMLNGVFCRYCVLFAQDEVGRSRVVAGLFVTTPFRRYTHWTGDVQKHMQRDYHAFAAARAEAFVVNMMNPGNEIVSKLDSAAQREIAKNRETLVPVIASILFLARCGIALRGHRDSGRIDVPDTCCDITGEEGNLRALLQFKAASGDNILRSHLETGAGNAFLPRTQLRSNSRQAQHELPICK